MSVKLTDCQRLHRRRSLRPLRLEFNFMLLHSLALLLLAAALHAIANALLKQARDKLAFAWWMLGAFCVMALPASFFVPRVPWTGWALVALSGLLEAVYFVTLTRAYTKGDLSQVYPIARGSAPLFLLCWAAVFLGERPTPAGLSGIASIVCGLYLINLPALSDWKKPLLGFKSPAARWALITGALISAYSAVDKVGVRYFPPFVYLFLILVVCWLALTAQWLLPHRREAILLEISPLGEAPSAGRTFSRKRGLTILAGAVLGTAAYFLVLAAMQLSPVSYVGPVREVSVVIGAWIGVRFMKEQGGTLRVAGSVLVSIGIILIAVGG